MIWGNAILPAGLLGLQQRGQGNVILGHHSVEHILVTISVLYGQLVELDKLLLKYIHMYMYMVHMMILILLSTFINVNLLVL